MCKKRISNFALIICLFGLISFSTGCQPDAVNKNKENNVSEVEKVEVAMTDKEQLGKKLFFEESLSTPEGQSCATCHDPSVAFADPVTELPVSRGAVHGLYGNRNDMPVSYSAYIPPLHQEAESEEGEDGEEGEDMLWVGGLFWDGRADTLEEQAKLPPLNPIEMANADSSVILEKLKNLSYSDLFIKVYGKDALSDAETAFNHMADAIAAYERTPEVNPFTSKYDYWLKREAELTEQELRGLKIFEAEDKGNCAACHPHETSEDGTPPLFTDFTYDNLGAPVNPEMPFFTMDKTHNPDGFAYRDQGLAVTVNDPAEVGKFRVPTLRNVAVTPPYLHNGVFKTLFQVVAFYNTRDVAEWPAPEISENVNMEELGDLRLTNSEMEDLVAFLNTLTDGWEKE